MNHTDTPWLPARTKTAVALKSARHTRMDFSCEDGRGNRLLLFPENSSADLINQCSCLFCDGIARQTTPLVSKVCQLIVRKSKFAVFPAHLPRPLAASCLRVWTHQVDADILDDVLVPDCDDCKSPGTPHFPCATQPPTLQRLQPAPREHRFEAWQPATHLATCSRAPSAAGPIRHRPNLHLH